MIEALSGLVVDDGKLGDVSAHVRFLGIFAVAMVAAGWLAYRRMVQVERQL
jgi:ABC-2 type transport system permease protein